MRLSANNNDVIQMLACVFTNQTMATSSTVHIISTHIIISYNKGGVEQINTTLIQSTHVLTWKYVCVAILDDVC